MSEGCFVVGTGRCGSTLLSDLLALHPAVCSVSEFFTLLGGGHALQGSVMSPAQLWEALSTASMDLRELLTAAPELPELRCDPAVQALVELGGVTPLALITLPALGVDDPGAVMTALRTVVERLQPARPEVMFSLVLSYLAQRMGQTLWVERSGGSLQYIDALVAGWPRAQFVHIVRSGPDCAVSMARHPFFRVAVSRLVNVTDHCG